MASKALAALLAGTEEVRDLQRANPTPPGGLPAQRQVVRAINRASVVLLSSHLERYLRGVNEEAIAQINANVILGMSLPERLRLQHSRYAVEAMLEMDWQHRAAHLASFVLHDGWLWAEVPKGTLQHQRLIAWMKSPAPNHITRLFQLWGVEDVFGRITRKPQSRGQLWLKLTELVEKRNNIAHGDTEATATYQDITSYLAAVQKFCLRADRVLARSLSRQLRIASPW